jgi:phosphoribosylamine--glycine ligase
LQRILIKHNIPTAAYDSFTAETVENGCKFGNTAATLCFESRRLAAGKAY